ncbi:G patch domain-containing protein 1, partial [Stegodyphus mimosarum]
MDDEEDDFITYGTPLPELEDEVTARKKTARELQVRDEKGRQRFHGAFTGGFSAGYFNTVGTKEGWAPSSFISSRGKAAERKQQNPEDFMDEEDFGEFGISTRKIHTTSNFQDFSEREVKKRRTADVDSIIPGEAPLKDIIKPVNDSIGVQILNKLGWKVGQGIGPRVKKYSSGTKIYGCSPYPDATVPEEEDSIALGFTFAPEDTEAILYQPKDNYFGLGYTGLSRQSVLDARFDTFSPTTTKSFLAKDKKKLTISGQAFGVGAFEDDDEDIYSKDDMSQYDFSELSGKSLDDSIKETGSKHMIGSSSGVIEGFHLASHPPTVKKHYPAPTLPSNFRPIHTVPQITHSHAITHDRTSRHALSADERSLLLGEKKFQLNASQKTEKNFESQQSIRTPLTQEQKLPSFRPFPNDLSKQERYEEYLKLKSTGELEKLKQPSSMTEWEKQQELEEFARAAVLFKPSSSALLSSKFESKSHLSVEHEVMSALKKLKDKEIKPTVENRKLVGSSNRKTVEWHPASLLCKRFNVPNPFPNSSESGVPHFQKDKSSLFENLSFTNDKPEKCDNPVISVGVPNSALEKSVSMNTEDTAKDTWKEKDFIQVIPVKNNEEQSSENKRPPIDLFKDIFENSSSEDENLDAKQKRKEELAFRPETEVQSTSLLSSQTTVICDKVTLSSNNNDTTKSISQTPSSNKRIGFGVFENLDLDALNQRTRVKESSVTKNLETKEPETFVEKLNVKDAKESIDHDSQCVTKLPDEFYGPELPPNYCGTSSSNSARTDFHRHSKHKVKHKHKHKHKYKNSKKRKKKKSSRKTSNEESSESDEDIPPAIIIEKLMKIQKIRK